MTTHNSQPKNLLKYLALEAIDHSIEKQDKVITLLNSLVDDKKDGKPPLLNA